MNRIIYSFKQAFIQIFRNKGMSIASVFAITAMLLILGLFFTVIININAAAENIKQDYNTIEIFLKDSTEINSIKNMEEEINKWQGVKETRYRTKEEALEILRDRWGKNAYLLEGLTNNPLPNSIVVKINNLRFADHIAKKSSELNGIEDVKFYKDTVDKLLKATGIFQIAALIIMVFLIIVSVVVVANTIKLTVLARSDEITIMKYVGATNWFIRGPFLFEGAIIGVFSALFSWGLIVFIYKEIHKKLSEDIFAIISTPMVPGEFLSDNLLWIFVALGTAIGAWGSIISMRRFLDT